MKKITVLLFALLISVASKAQFEQGKIYVGASLSSIDLSYSGLQKGQVGLQAKGGYMFADNLLATAQFGYEKQKDVPYQLSMAAGARYYIVQNGLYLGASASYKHRQNYNDILPGVQIGYAFFLSRTVTVEPELYYDQSFKRHSDYSTIGLRIGVGVYLFTDKK